MKISVIVETTGEGKALLSCIGSAKRILDDILVVGCPGHKEAFAVNGCSSIRFYYYYICTPVALNNVVKEADNELILFLKDTEQLSEELIAEIKYLRNTGKELACRIKQRILHRGKLIRHAKAESSPIRFFHRQLGKWRKKRGQLSWYPFNTEMDIITADACMVDAMWADSQMIRCQIELTSSEQAINALIANRNVSRSFNYLKPVAQFINDYILHKGFLDGRAGFSYCRLNSYNSYLNYKKTRVNFRKLRLYNTAR
jgi:hypothetical protein